MTESSTRLGSFAVRGVIWRRYLDWAVTNVPFYLQPFLLFFTALFFFFFAASERRAVVGNLAAALPGSWRVVNYFRAFRVLLQFSWTIAEAANYKMNKAEFAYEIEGPEFLERLAAARGAIVLTAHMGNYDLGAALFAQKFSRDLRMVRAPEQDSQTAQHLSASVQQTGEGAIKIDYNTRGPLLSFDLLSALRSGEIVSIQGDRAIRGGACAEGRLFGQDVLLPSGPFTLALVAEVPIFPLFIMRGLPPLSHHRPGTTPTGTHGTVARRGYLGRVRLLV
jgi:lauroyl/myristoyl acyltransferase